MERALGAKPIKSCAAECASEPPSDIADVERSVREGPITAVKAGHSTLMPAALMIGHHFAISALW